MKKITPKQYAQALYLAIQDKKEEDQPEIFENFLKLIWQRKDGKNLNKIVRSFETVYKKNEGILEARVVSARQLTAELKNQIKAWLNKNGNQSVFLAEEVDQSLLGGLVIHYEDTVYDLSLKNLISHLQKELNKSHNTFKA